MNKPSAGNMVPRRLLWDELLAANDKHIDDTGLIARPVFESMVEADEIAVYGKVGQCGEHGDEHSKK